MNVQLLTISLGAISDDGNNDELVLCNKVPNAALLARRLVAVVRLHVELQRRNQWQ